MVLIVAGGMYLVLAGAVPNANAAVPIEQAVDQAVDQIVACVHLR